MWRLDTFERETHMILELADIRIHPGQQAEFDKAIELGLKST
jgi:hypothetical protein